VVSLPLLPYIHIPPPHQQEAVAMGPNFISALILTAMNGYQEDVAPFLALSRETWGEEILWDACKDVRYGDERRTRLMYAAKIGDLARVRWLLKRGAKVNLVDESQRTAVYFACTNGHFDVVRELLKEGASFQQCSKCKKCKE